MKAEDAMGTLQGGLWHTTSEERYEGILAVGAILAEPPVPDEERWATRCGARGWPYVRKLSGVSLFDFEGFDVKTYEAQCPASSWREFVPFRRAWGASVWIEIDRASAEERLVSGEELLARQNEEIAHRHRLMPYIEAAYVGNVGTELFSRVRVGGKGDSDFRLVAT